MVVGSGDGSGTPRVHTAVVPGQHLEFEGQRQCPESVGCPMRLHGRFWLQCERIFHWALMIWCGSTVLEQLGLSVRWGQTSLRREVPRVAQRVV